MSEVELPRLVEAVRRGDDVAMYFWMRSLGERGDAVLAKAAGSFVSMLSGLCAARNSGAKRGTPPKPLRFSFSVEGEGHVGRRANGNPAVPRRIYEEYDYEAVRRLYDVSHGFRPAVGTII